MNSNKNSRNFQALRDKLPEDAFLPTPSKIVVMVIHVAISCACFYVATSHNQWWQIFLLAVISGHSLTCMGFVAHELSHGMIVKNRIVTRVLESIFWSTVFVAPTMWRRAHNSTHHIHYGTLHDSDRMFTTSELTPLKKWYAKLFYPNAEIFPWNPLVFFYQVPYFLRNTLAALLPQSISQKFIPSLPRYRVRDGLRVLADIGFIVLIQFLYLWITDFNWKTYAVMMVITQLTSSVIVMAYVFTNHFLSPLAEHADPLKGSTSVIVPRWIDWLHSNFSYHSEHHVFPNLRSKHYPLLSKHLAESFPDDYRRIPFGMAWKLLWQNPSALELKTRD